MAPKSAAGIFAGSRFSFTEARVEQARKAVLDGLVDTVADGRRSWLDADCPGLRLTVNAATGSSVFYLQAKIDGQTVRRALGDTDAVRLVEAREAVRRLRYDRTVAGALAPRPSAQDEDEGDGTPIVKAVMDDYLDAHEAGRWLPGSRSRTPTDRTMSNYRNVRRAVMTEKIRRKVKGTDDTFQTVDGEDFELLTLAAFAARLPEIHAAIVKRAPVQANRALQLWRNVYAYAADTGSWSGPNPAVGTGKADRLAKTTEGPRQRVLTDAELKRLDAAMKADAPLWHGLFRFSLVTLQRMGAVCHARWDDIVMTGPDAAWTVPKAWMKGRRSAHRIPLADCPEALEVLKARRAAVPKGCPWVFPGEDMEPVRNYDKAWKRILKRAKLWSDDREQRPRPHDLRRTGGSRMVSAGVPLNTVTKALGDAPSSVGMVAKTYAHVMDDALRDAFAAVARRGRRR
jgi:integrase